MCDRSLLDFDPRVILKAISILKWLKEDMVLLIALLSSSIKQGRKIFLLKVRPAEEYEIVKNIWRRKGCPQEYSRNPD
jgi:hypothetical protein